MFSKARLSVLSNVGRQVARRPGGVFSAEPRRSLNLHEYMSKNVLSADGVTIQRGLAASNAQEAFDVCARLPETKEIIIKAQVLAGGRGKGHFDNGFKGGVHICKTAEEVRTIADKMLGHRLITNQTPKDGIEVTKVLVAECLDLKRELYFALALDRAARGPVIIASPRGGMDIETVAHESPEDILVERIHPIHGITAEQSKKVAAFLGFTEGTPLFEKARAEMTKIYTVFCKRDCTLLEINPLAETDDGRVACVDAKFDFDDNAEYRQKEMFAQRDWSVEDPREVAAAKAGLNYIGLTGNIGCLVNGAGLAMATMDIIKLHGGDPANFLDVGGGATKEQVVNAFRIITSDSRVKSILVNIFGGIMKCDIIARGLIEAVKEVNLQIPLVVRLAGTNSDLAKQILASAQMNIISGVDLDDAAKKAVASVSSL